MLAHAGDTTGCISKPEGRPEMQEGCSMRSCTSSSRRPSATSRGDVGLHVGGAETETTYVGTGSRSIARLPPARAAQRREGGYRRQAAGLGCAALILAPIGSLQDFAPKAASGRPGRGARRRDAHAELGVLRAWRPSPPPIASQDLPTLCPRRPGLGGEPYSAPSPTLRARCVSPSTSTGTAGASATSPSATRQPRGERAGDHFQARFSWAARAAARNRSRSRSS